MVCVRISESEVIARKIYVDVLCPPFNEIRAFFCILVFIDYCRRFVSLEFQMGMTAKEFLCNVSWSRKDLTCTEYLSLREIDEIFALADIFKAEVK